MALRILIVDDNPLDRELVARGLKTLPVPPGPAEVVACPDWSSGQLALGGGGFDLLLLDTNLRGVSGLDVLRDPRRPDIPVILMSGQADEAIHEEALRLGACDFVLKSAQCGPGLCRAVRRALAPGVEG